MPTWNYAVVHLHGTLRVRDERDWLLALLGERTDRHEAGRAAPWAVDDAPADHLDRLLGTIVGIEIPVARVGAKFKLSQKQPAANRAGVVAALDGEPDAAALSALMRAVAAPRA